MIKNHFGKKKSKTVSWRYSIFVRCESKSIVLKIVMKKNAIYTSYFTRKRALNSQKYLLRRKYSDNTKVKKQVSQEKILQVGRIIVLYQKQFRLQYRKRERLCVYKFASAFILPILPPLTFNNFYF